MSQSMRVAALVLWTAAILIGWIWWTSSALTQEGAQTDAVRSSIVLVTSGCCGGSWMVGLLAMVLVFAILRK